ncbi:hypothetical protein GCM10007940_35980 [Portibacter lacus]|uniref:Uncharacterized protein n=2 Tax=Portibacter lacus TaxID=1099794 RepID=A0AA37SS91_9BACT|nr:hypothetical protein GCM10007940_35980 [Portibacter lacus]
MINDIIDAISDNEEEYEKRMLEFSEAQPFLLSFLLSEGFQVLDEQEKSLLFYLAMIIYFSITQEHEEPDTIELIDIQRTDEENWTLVDAKKFKTLKEIADYFFEDYEQEDLLAFVEDALGEDEEYEVSKIGRNVIFVSMKSFIDVLHVSIPTIEG